MDANETTTTEITEFPDGAVAVVETTETYVPAEIEPIETIETIEALNETPEPDLQGQLNALAAGMDVLQTDLQGAKTWQEQQQTINNTMLTQLQTIQSQLATMAASAVLEATTTQQQPEPEPEPKTEPETAEAENGAAEPTPEPERVIPARQKGRRKEEREYL